jgi:hypothetical protein
MFYLLPLGTEFRMGCKYVTYICKFWGPRMIVFRACILRKHIISQYVDLERFKERITSQSDEAPKYKTRIYYNAEF